MNLEEMKRRVYSVLRDSEKAFIIDEDVEDWLNEAYLDIVSRIGLLHAEASGTTSASGTFTLPADFLRVDGPGGFTLATDDPDVFDSPQPARQDIFQSYKLNNLTPGVPIYMIKGDTVYTWPEADTVAYTFSYIYKPVALATQEDEPALPEELHTKLVNYARGHGKMKEGEHAEATFYLGLFYEGLPPTTPDTMRENPGPIDLVPVPTYWSSR